MKQQSYFMRHSLWRKRNWKTILKVALVLLLLSDGAWVLQHRALPLAYAASVSPQAVTVYGQAGSFTVGTSSEFYSPRNSVTDSSGDVYIADTSHHRVLYYPAGSTTATRSYGQGGSLTTTTANEGGLSANSLDHPFDIALDSNNNLYIADTTNNRVLYYPSGTTTATRVYGQNGSFTTALADNTGGTANIVSTTGLSNPLAVALDSNNNLYITDNGNNRVLYYPSGTTTATRVYGQNGSFTTALVNNTGGTANTVSATSLNQPGGIDLDSSNNLYIADFANDRVLYYPSSTTTATRVYGQNGSFTTALVNNTGGTANTVSATSLSSPQGVALDSNNNLYVAEQGNNRVLYYPSGTTTATRVYGQNGSFTTALVNNTGGTANTVSATSLDLAYGVNIGSNGYIYITDNSNHRVLVYQTSLTLITQPPTSTVPGATFSAAAGLIDVGSGGAFSDPNTISVAIKSGTGTTGATLSGTTSISAASGATTFSNLSINLPGAGYILTISSSGMSSVNTNAFTISTLSTLVGYWPLDEGSGTTTADLSGNNNTGTLIGASWTTGKVNNALSFNGTNNYVNVGTPSPAALQLGTSSFTVSAWFKTSNSTSPTRVVSSGDNTSSSGYYLGVGSGSTCSSNYGCVSAGLGSSPTTNTVTFATSATTFNDGNWHQETMVIDRTAGTAQLYVDGVLQPLSLSAASCGAISGSTSINLAGGTACTNLNASGTEHFTIGGNNISSQSFNGSIDEVRVYGSALNSSLIQNQYAIDTTASPTSYWPLDENSGTTAYDSSSNHNNGTLTGGPTWTNGVLNSALSFNGSTNYVTMGTPATLKFGVGSFTIMSWFKTTATASERIVSTGVSSWSNGFDLGVNTTGACSAGCVGAEIGGGSKAASVSFGTTATTFNDGNWHQAAMIIDQTANTAQLYVDGIAQPLSTQSGTCGTASGTSIDISTCISATATSSTDPFTLGAYHSGSTTNSQFTGTIDEVRVYNSALTGPQIFNRYNNDTILSPEGYWRFDEDSGTTAYDSSGNNNNGTITGASWSAGEVNSGLSFNGTSNYVKTGTSPSALQFGTNSFTVINWFKTSNTASFNRMVSMGAQSNSTGYFSSVSPYPTGCIGCVGGGIGATTGTAAATTIFYTTSTFNDGNWHQEAMVVDQTAKTIQVYIDGVAQTLAVQTGTCGTASGTSISISSCSSLSASNAAEAFTIGSHNGVGEYFHGSIDEVGVYGNALSNPQILTLYTNNINALSENAANASFSGTVGHTVTYTLPIALTYQLASAPGWSISITSTTLTSGANTLPTTASTITSVTGICVTTCTPTTLTNTVSGFPITLPAATTAPTAVKFLGTAASTGIGAYTVTPTISVKIPISAKLGSYTSVVTLAAAVGP
jgi:Concanavalin A-like lectin/glucanases superfamily/NHL repeat